MRPRAKSALLWGAIGSVSFLVALQGYRLLVSPLRFGVVVALGTALAVGVVVAAVTYATEGRLTAKGRT